MYVRNAALSRVAQVNYCRRLRCIARHDLDDHIGTWILDIDAANPATQYLTADGAGIILVEDGTTLFSGPVTEVRYKRTAETKTYEISGVDDNIVLQDRIALPEPLTAPSATHTYPTNAYDTRTGVASTIMRQYVDRNCGPSATSPRKNSLVTLGTDPVAGSTVTGNARYQPLLEILTKLAIEGGGLGYRAIQSESNIEFQVYTPTDRSSTVVFSMERGTLYEYEYSIKRSTGNYIYVAGQNEGVARTIYELFDGDSIVRWGRVERFKDQRDTNVAADLTASGQEELETGATIATVNFTPKDTDQQHYGTHYNLGDRVTVVIDGEAFSDVIREVEFIWDSDKIKIIPTVGTQNSSSSISLYDRLSRTSNRIRLLERR